MSEVNLSVQSGNLTISGDVVGRDKIVNNIQNIIQRALTFAEESAQDRTLETQVLAQGLGAFVSRLQAVASETSDAEGGSPYKGLLAYRLSDAEIFFGRSQAIAGVFSRLQRGALTILHSESGAGKSSLVQAGISPRLIGAGHLPVYIRPYDDNPAIILKRAFLSDLSQTPLLATAPLRDFLRQVCQVVGQQTTLYIILDQAEELFTQLEEPARAEFVGELAECLSDDSLNVRWLFSMRTEFFGNLANFRPQIQDPFDNDYRLNRLTRAEAQEVIAEPVRRRNITYEAGLAEAMLDDLSQGQKQEVAPPEIQLVCSALYEDLKPGQTAITRDRYNALGGAVGILRSHLEQVLSRNLPPDHRPIAQRALESLITADGHRVIRARDELAAEVSAGFPRPIPPETLEAVLDQLTTSHLVRTQEQAQMTAAPTYELAPGVTREMATGLAYELAHDYLLDKVKLDPATQARKAAQELLAQEVRAFERHGTLLSDDKLAILAPRRDELVLSEPAKLLLQKSDAAFRRRRGLLAGGIGLVILLLVVGVASISSAVGAQASLRDARNREATSVAMASTAAVSVLTANTLAAQAESSARQAEEQQAASEAAAAEAARQKAEAQAAAQAAKDVIHRLFEREGLVGLGNLPRALAYDGQRIWVILRDDNTVQPVDPETGEAGLPILVGTEPSALAVGAGKVWVANRRDNTVQDVDPETGEAGEPIPVGQRPVALAFDGQGRLWVAHEDDNTIQVIDPATREVGKPIPVETEPAAFAFDGVQLWVINRGGRSLQSIEPVTGEIGLPIPLGDEPRAIVYDGSQLWITLSDSSSVRTFNPTTNALGIPIPVGHDPLALAFDGDYVWVANRLDNTVQAIDRNGGVSAPYRVGNGPSSLVVVGEWLWTTNRDDNSVQRVDLTAGDLSALITVGQAPSAMAFDGKRLWIVNTAEDTVQAYEVNSARLLPPIKVGSSPRAIAFDGQRLWIAHFGADTVQALDPQTGQLGASVTVGDGPAAVIFDGTQLWVANRRANTVQAIDPQTGQAGPPMAVGQAPGALAFDRRRLWVVLFDEDAVQAIDLKTGQVGPKIEVGRDPRAITFDGRLLWVANRNDDSVQSIDPATGQASDPIRVGNDPTGLAFDGACVWVANRNSNSLSAIDPATRTIVKRLKVGIGPATLVFSSDAIWIAYSEGNTVQFLAKRKCGG